MTTISVTENHRNACELGKSSPIVSDFTATFNMDYATQKYSRNNGNSTSLTLTLKVFSIPSACFLWGNH